MRIKPLAVLAAVAALGIPATTAVAKPHDDKAAAKQEHASKHGKAAKPAKARNAVFKGTVSAVDGTRVTVTVAKANRWGRALKGQDVAFDVSGLKHAPTVTAGDAVLVQARIAADAAAPFAARKLNVLREDGDDAPEAASSDDD